MKSYTFSIAVDKMFLLPEYVGIFSISFPLKWGWLGVAKVSCILHHWGIQLVLAYSWAQPTILVAGKGRGEMLNCFCFFTFSPVPLSSLTLSFISYLFSLFLWETTQNDPQGLTCH